MNHRTRRTLFQTGLLVLVAVAVLATAKLAKAAEPPNQKPNIVFFLVDDMGWMDTTVNGSQYYETPNMERLAERSMTFTDAHTASPLCSPTRASIMSGKYPARTGITSATGHKPPLAPGAPRFPQAASPDRKMLLPISRNFLRPEEYTIAEALRDAGYRTAHIGKWHLGLNPEHWPEAQGFEVSFHGAPDPGPRSYFSPYQFQAGTVTDGPEGEYIADRVTDEALSFIENHSKGPFLLHLWHYNVHGPWGHKEEITKRFVGKKDPRGRQNNPVMASMLKSVDESLGRVIDKLDELGIADNTIIIFFSDNGGNIHSNTRTDSKTAKIREGHPRWPRIESYRRYAGYLPPTNNYPLRKGKAWIYEGGTRVPMMVCWPGVVEPGSVCSTIVTSVDFYPTMLEMAGVSATGRQLVDGVSIVPLLKQTGKLDREEIFCYFPHGGPTRPAGAYVRSGDWKLIRWFNPSEFYPNELELYNLKDDLGETTNLAAKMPDKAAALDALIDRHFEETGALAPKANPAYNPNLRPIQGWRALGSCKLTAGRDGLVIETSKGRVQMQTGRVPEFGGPLVLTIRSRSNRGGFGIVYWGTAKTPSFSPERRVDFEPVYDGQWHEYAVPFTPEEPITKLRLDVSSKPGRVEVASVRLSKNDGTVLQAWEFERGQDEQ